MPGEQTWRVGPHSPSELLRNDFDDTGSADHE